MAKDKVLAAALQYSKWLSRFICWVWAIYRFSVLFASALVPEAAEALVSTIGTLDTIMLVNEGTYLVNSLGEKWIYSERFILSAFKKGWFKTITARINANQQGNTKEEEEEEKEEDSDNG